MVISNTTPLINFSCIDRLDILESLFTELIIPQTVRTELIEKVNKFPNIQQVLCSGFISVKQVMNKQLVDSLTMDLHRGEAEVIVLGLENRNSLLILDEIDARNIAKFHELKFTGTIGCLLEAKSLNIIAEIKPLLDLIQTKANFWIHNKLYEQILKDAQENDDSTQGEY
ncbi:MAG: DUF3368 domain-containing protein [Leptospiraceae bacterium]|nr:DUF3368 domain-containing protein [Leptospiraceae bacterium]